LIHQTIYGTKNPGSKDINWQKERKLIMFEVFALHLNRYFRPPPPRHTHQFRSAFPLSQKLMLYFKLIFFIPFSMPSFLLYSTCVFCRFVMSGLPLQNASPSSAVSQVSLITTSGQESKPKKKICCACPETKKLRDECVVEHGEAACAKWIDAHRQCLRAEGFNI